MATTTRILDANVNGTVYTSNANSALEALDTCHSGSTAPTDEVANGKLWLDTSTTPAILKVYDNAGWNIVYSGRGDLDVEGTMTATTLLGDGSGLTGIIAGMTFALKTADYTAAHLEGVIADTSGGTFTITLPATPSAGDYVVVSDGGDWAATNLTVARNGSTIEGDLEDMTMDIGGVFVTFVYDGVTWQTYTTVGADNSQFATAAQGALADTAVQPNDSPTFADLTATGAFTSLGIDDNAASTAVTIDASGNVGVGTISPNGRLEVLEDASQIALRISSSNGNTAGTIKTSNEASANNKLIISATRGSGAILFETDSAERMRIDSGGSVGIAKTPDTNRATIGHEFGAAGYSFHTRNSGTLLFLNRAGTDGAIIEFYNDAVLRGSISVSGSSTAYNTSSDYRLKENITPVQNAGDIVKAMQPVTYTFKSDGSWHDGFLAHELQELHPRAVIGEKDAVDEEGNPDYQGVDYSKLTPILTAALQEALNKIDALEARITALEAI